MTYTTLQNYTNTVVGKHGYNNFALVVGVWLLLLLLFDDIARTRAHPSLILDK